MTPRCGTTTRSATTTPMRSGDPDRDAVDRAFAELVAGYHLTAEPPEPPPWDPPVPGSAPSPGIGVRAPAPPAPTASRATGSTRTRTRRRPAPMPAEGYDPGPPPPLPRPPWPVLVGWIGLGYAMLTVLRSRSGSQLPRVGRVGRHHRLRRRLRAAGQSASSSAPARRRRRRRPLSRSRGPRDPARTRPGRPSADRGSRAGPGPPPRSARRRCGSGPAPAAPAGGSRDRSGSAANIWRAGCSSRSPAALTPPPITTRSGSSAAARLAIPWPSHWPTSASSSIAVCSPSTAAAVTPGPVILSGSPPSISSRRYAIGELLRASSRASRTRALPEAYCSQQPAVAALAPVPTRHADHVAPLPRHPVGAAEQVAVDHQPAADAGAEGDADHHRRAPAGAEPVLRPGRRVRVVVDDQREVDAFVQSVLQRFLAPGEVR